MKFKILVHSLLVVLFFCSPAEAKRKKRRSYQPPVTHPVVLWARTLSQSGNQDERKVAAFKLSQYSQPIYQEEATNTLIRCMRDPEVQIKVLCAKAMGKAGTQGKTESIRKSILEVYREDPGLRSTLVRTFIVRKDSSPAVQEALLSSLKASTNAEETITLLQYFENFASSSAIDGIIEAFNKSSDEKVRRMAVKALVERGQGQPQIVTLLADCAESKDTPLSLLCLSGLQTQAQKDSRTWAVLEKTVESTDPDVLLATLDVLQALPSQHNAKISLRLVEIIRDADDSELLEKAVLALGVCGDGSETVVKALHDTLEKKGGDEGAKITAALVLGKQAVNYSEGPKASLEKCSKDGGSQSLRTACQLGLKELLLQKPTPTTAGASATPVKAEQ